MNERRIRVQAEKVRDLRTRHAQALAKAGRVIDSEKAAGRNPLLEKESNATVAAAYSDVDQIEALRTKAEEELHSMMDAAVGELVVNNDQGRTWATEVAGRILQPAGLGVQAALFTAPIEVPSPVEPGVVALPENPTRLLDVLVERRGLESNVYEYLRQTARTTNADTVPDFGQKPTSVYTVTPLEDRARVIAHLSEPIPERFLMDESELIAWLQGEMFTGVLDALELQVANGSGAGEDMRGVLQTSGIAEMEFDTNIFVTMRQARTELAIKSEQPTAWAINPMDVETIDLAREEADGQFLAATGLANVFGDLPKVVTNSVPAGTAVLADWRQTRLYIRESVKLQGDRSGENFEKNQVVWRAEGRFGFAVLRPQAVVAVQLTDE